MNKDHFVMSVSSISYTPATEYSNLTGIVQSGKINVETEVVLSNGRHAFLVEIIKDGKNVTSAAKGDEITLHLLNLSEKDLQDLPQNLYVEADDDFYENRLTNELSEHNKKVKVLDVPPTTDELDEPFKMQIESAFWVEAKKGYLLTGIIKSGIINLDETITLSNGMKAKVKEFDNGANYACAFDTNVGILISGIKKGELDGVENLIAE